MLDVRYGNRRIELQPGKPTIEVGDAENLLSTIQAVREAVAGCVEQKSSVAYVRSRGTYPQEDAGRDRHVPDVSAHFLELSSPGLACFGGL